MIDLILLAAGIPRLDDETLLAETQGKPLYRHAFEAARRTADAMLGLRVIVVTRPACWTRPSGSSASTRWWCRKNRPLSQAVIAGAKAARSGASRCFLSCGQTWVTGEVLTAFLQGYILSGRPLGRVRSTGQEGGPMVFGPYLLPHLLALQSGEDGSSLFQGREGRTYHYDAFPQAPENGGGEA